MFWYSGQTALFLSLLAKAAPAYSSTAFLCGTEATLSFSAGPVCSSFSTEASAILHALCWSRQHQQVCHFSSLLLSDSRSVLSSVFPFTETFFLFPVLSGYNGSPDTRFSRGRARLMSSPDGESYLRPLQSLSSYLGLEAYCLIEILWHAGSLEELVLPRHARCVLSRLRYNGHSLLLKSSL